MANFNFALGQTGLTLYAIWQRTSDQEFVYANGSVIEAYSAAHWTNYALALTEIGATGVYAGTFPTASTVTANSYSCFIRQQAGGSPVVSPATDVERGTGSGDWNGAVFGTNVAAINNIPATAVATINANIGLAHPLQYTLDGGEYYLDVSTNYWNGTAVISAPNGNALVFVKGYVDGNNNVSTFILGKDGLAVTFANDTTINPQVGSAHELLVDLSGDVTFNNTSIATVTAVGTVVNPVTVGTNNDKTGYSLTTAGYQAAADTTLRRHAANAEGSASGDTLALGTLYSVIQQLQQSNTTSSAGFITVNKTDGTLLGTISITSNSGAAPITGASASGA